MLILRIRRKGRTGDYKKLNSDRMVIMDNGTLMTIIGYIEFYYSNVMSNVIGYSDGMVFQEVSIWDTEEHYRVEELISECPEEWVDWK